MKIYRAICVTNRTVLDSGAIMEIAEVFLISNKSCRRLTRTQEININKDMLVSVWREV